MIEKNERIPPTQEILRRGIRTTKDLDLLGKAMMRDGISGITVSNHTIRANKSLQAAFMVEEENKSGDVQ